ncbi:phosphoenolpyruvate phosphomutase [Chloropicon primus]|uniref:Phosphoenolpyruvate phosphomutase n=1 Tax=Chloropicon primus TaxID=1764295 RepID=A0A5B8MQA4_9CHLO|nr:phosphoenolpyruvate phosphomutase [Chloropicon primus]UPR00781.1 phosphoenolpyruvate phosphomutase [Chloropicon primus]|eukprot:QDZ21570.1 phosphoenolpyruvate phosphomutase [Chloropicon primus]
MSPSSRLRRLLHESSEALACPCCHDALSAKLIERAGFEVAFVSGFTTSASRLGAPDAQLITYSEMLDESRAMKEATKELCLIVDADNGYGNVLNVRRAVEGYARAGMAGILLEDQVNPKSCGHVLDRKEVVSREECVARLKMATDTRDEMGSRPVVIGRTDAKRAESMEEALWRVEAFLDLGCDAVFVDALETREEMNQVAGLVRGARARGQQVVAMASLLEGGVSPTNFSLEELHEMGFTLVSYPLSLLGVSINAMQEALLGLREGRVPEQIPPFEEMKEILGFPEYFRDLNQYTRDSESFVARRRRVDDDNDEPAVEAEVPGRSDIVLAEVVTTSDEGGAGWRANGPLKLRVTNVQTGVKEIEVTLPSGVGRDVKDLISLLSSFGLNLQDQDQQQQEPVTKAVGGKDYLIDSVNEGKRIEVWIDDDSAST